jgi:hypothetical protein
MGMFRLVRQLLFQHGPIEHDGMQGLAQIVTGGGKKSRLFCAKVNTV